MQYRLARHVMGAFLAFLLYLTAHASLVSSGPAYANLSQALDNHESILYDNLHRLAIIDQVSAYIAPIRSVATRNVKSLNGLYDFCFDPNGEGFANRWYERSLLDTCPQGDYYRMPVPSAFNDILSNKTARDYVGWMWYQTDAFWLRGGDCLWPDRSMAHWRESSRESTAANWFLQIDSINYFSIIWIQLRLADGFEETSLVGAHVGGHLPVTMNVSSLLNKYDANQVQLKLVIAVSNQLTADTIPSAQMINMTRYVGKPSFKFQPDFDFFNFAGIMGNVQLVQLPEYYIEEVIQLSDPSISGHLEVRVCLNAAPGASQPSYVVFAHVAGLSIASERASTDDRSQRVRCNPGPANLKMANRCELLTLCLGEQSHIEQTEPQTRRRHSTTDATAAAAAAAGRASSIKARFNLHSATQYTASNSVSGPPLEVSAASRTVVDSFELKLRVGGWPRRRNIVELLSPLGTTSLADTTQLQGFGMHHEQMFSGRTMSLPAIMKDLYLLKQLGANVIRTSHYPYSSAYLEACDELGLMVIAECPAVGLNSFSDIKLMLHKQILLEMMQRDHAHPSIVMWSLANEPQSQLPEARAYFASLLSFARHDLQQFTTRAGRPLTAAIAQSHLDDTIGDLFDVLMINRYYGWYECLGSLECISHSLNESLTGWADKYGHGKPLIVSEFGADTVAGLHSTTSEMFSEEYQRDLIVAHERLFDQLAAGRALGKINFLGAMIWNFADFSTHESLLRVGGNRKGLFTRDRRPKLAANTVQQIYKSRPPIRQD